MSVKSKVLSAGVLFFLGGQMMLAQKAKNDTVQKEKKIEEVVIVGFGQKKVISELTGSVGKIGKEIADVSLGSIDKALAGRVPGVQTGMSTGQPGGAAAIRIRGMASVNGRNNPIVVIDGVRVAQGDLTQNTTTANILANLNEADIESVTVLKDAVSTAVYGADAGAGVVIITTKSGKRGRAQFNVSSETGVSYRAVEGYKSLTASQYRQLLAQSLANEKKVGYNMAYQNAVNGVYGGAIATIFNAPYDTDWRRETENTGGAVLSKVNASVSGGNDKITYFSSLGYFEQEGIVRNSSFKRTTFATKVNYRATDKLTLSSDLQASYGKTSTLSGGGSFANPIFGQYFLRPTDPVRNPDGSYNLGVRNRMSNNLFNVAALQDLNYQHANTARIFGNLQAEYKFFKGLSYRFVFAPEFINIEEDNYRSPLHGDGFNLGGSMTSYSTRYFNFNIQNILSYAWKLGEVNNFSASLIQEAYKEDYRLVGGNSNVVGSPKLYTLDNFIIPRDVRGTKAINTRGGYAATLHYDYDKLFLLDLSGRQDKVSNFWPDKKTGYFWSAGVGIDLARLEFIKNIDAISRIKFSASYGKVGNMPSKDVIPYSTYRYSFNYGEQAGGYPRGVNNPDLRWESVKPFNAGLDLAFFKNRLNLGVAYYHKETSDMIFSIPLSLAQAGYTVVNSSPYAIKYVNVGTMSNSGFEFNISADIIKTEDFRWNLGGNLGTLNNKVTKLFGGNDVISGSRILREGEVANAFYMRKWAGVDRDTGKPLWYINGKDGETTSNYNQAKMEIQGSPYATLFGGVDTQIEIKNFTIDAQMSYGFGSKIYGGYMNYLFSDGQYVASYPGVADQLDYWTPENKDALNPAPIFGKGNLNASATSTRFLYKGDHLRLRSLKVAYTFNKNTLSGTGLSAVQIYLVGNNIWTYTFDKNLKFDPDFQVGGTSSLALPPMKTYSLGVNLTF